MNPLKKLAAQTITYGLSSVIGRLLNFLLVPIYTRYFSPEHYGVVTELYAYAAFLIVILTYGIETSFFRYAQKEKNKKSVYSTALISLTVSSVVFMILMFLFATPLAEYLQYENHPEYIQYFALIIGLDAISAISFANLRNENKAVKFTFIRLVNIFVNIGLNLVFIVHLNLSIEYIFISNLIASVITFFMLFPEMIKSIWIFDVQLWKKMMIYAFPLLIAGLAGITNEVIDRVLLKHLLNDSLTASRELGLYGAFYKLSIFMTLFIQTFRFAAEPFYFKHGKEKKSKDTYAEVMKYFIIIGSIIFLCITLFYDVFKNFIDEEYHDDRGFLVVSVLLLANLFLGIYYNLSIWYKLSDKTKYGAFLSIFGAVITISLNFILIPIIGFEGSAWATLACYFSMTIASYFLGKKYYEIQYPIKRISFYLIFAIAIFLISSFWELEMLFKTLCIILFIGVAYILEKPKKAVISNPKSPY